VPAPVVVVNRRCAWRRCVIRTNFKNVHVRVAVIDLLEESLVVVIRLAVTHFPAVELRDQTVVVQEVEGILIVAKCVQSAFANSLNETDERLGYISR
jgi:hypothetical protein